MGSVEPMEPMPATPLHSNIIVHIVRRFAYTAVSVSDRKSCDSITSSDLAVTRCLYWKEIYIFLSTFFGCRPRAAAQP